MVSLATVITAFVSIHAPTRGATRAFDSPTLLLQCFNPRTHAGCDPAVSMMTVS